LTWVFETEYQVVLRYILTASSVHALYGLNYGPDNSPIGSVSDETVGAKRGIGVQIFGLPHTITPSAKASHTHVVIHETLACQCVDENVSSCRKPTVNLSPEQQTDVDHKQDFPIAYDVLYDKEETGWF